MKWIKRYPLLFSLVISGLVLSGAGLAGKQGIYRNYTYEIQNMPLSSLVFFGLHDKIWQGNQTEECLADAVQEAGNRAVDGSREAGKLTGSGENRNAAGENTTDGGAMQASVSTVSGSGTENPPYAFRRVSEDYFDDALFIGDSRTVGLYDYAGLNERADFYCKTSLTVWDVLEKPIVKLEGEKKLLTVEEALTRKQFGKIYLMVGINELGRGNIDLFMEQYEKVVARIRELQPDAVLFVEGIMRVAGEKNSSDPIFNNTNINARNDRIRLLADDRDIFYIDVNEAVCDEDGNLREEYTFDQIHLKAAYYMIWKEFLLEHGIVREQESVSGQAAQEAEAE